MSHPAKIEISIDIDQPGLMPVDILAEASGLSRTAVKDAMAKGAVWLSKQHNITVANELELDLDNKIDKDNQTLAIEDSPDDPPASDIWSAAWPNRQNAATDIGTDKSKQEKPALDKKTVAIQARPRRLRRGKKTLQVGQTIALHYDQKVIESTCPPAELISDEGSFSVWHKPAGMLCQGSRWGDHTTIARWAEKHLSPQRTAFVVHRIDKMTAGLVVLAHSKKAAAHLSKQFADRCVEKTYKAIINQQFNSPLPLLIDTALDCKACLTTIVSARPITLDDIAGKLNKAADQNAILDQRYLDQHYSELEIRIATGRKHQIRRHLNSLGYSVLGDRLYPLANASASEQEKPAQAITDIDLQLRAVALRLKHPDTEVLHSYQLND